MTIDLERDRLTLTEAAQLLAKDLSTIWRWCLRGVRGRKLASFVIGGRRYVYRDDLDDFLAAQNADDPRPAQPTQKSKRRNAAAAKKLDALGIGT